MIGRGCLLLDFYHENNWDVSCFVRDFGGLAEKCRDIPIVSDTKLLRCPKWSPASMWKYWEWMKQWNITKNTGLMRMGKNMEKQNTKDMQISNSTFANPAPLLSSAPSCISVWRLSWKLLKSMGHTVGGKKSGFHQLKLVVYPIIYMVLAPSQVVIAGFLPSTVSWISWWGESCATIPRQFTYVGVFSEVTFQLHCPFPRLEQTVRHFSGGSIQPWKQTRSNMDKHSSSVLISTRETMEQSKNHWATKQ